jgi:transcriptional regulator of arginine metabolism
MEKAERQSVIKDLIERESIMSQEDLKSHLAVEGYYVAQATLSRDIKEMGLIKTPSGYKLHNLLKSQNSVTTDSILLKNSKSILSDSINSLEFGTGLAVMHTPPGHASMVASLLDSAELAPVMGTIAGDDTILIMLRPTYSSDETVEALSGLVDNLSNKLA